MPTMTNCKCKNCGDPFKARLADVKRGWGQFCSKSCKAKKQEKRTGQYAKFLYKHNIDKREADYHKYEKDFHIMDPYSLGQD